MSELGRVLITIEEYLQLKETSESAVALQQKIGELEAANALLAETSERNIYSWKQIHDRIMGMYETVSEALNCKDLGLTEHGIRVLIGRMNAAEDHVKILEAKVKKLTTPPAKREYHVGINRVEKTLECYVRIEDDKERDRLQCMIGQAAWPKDHPTPMVADDITTLSNRVSGLEHIVGELTWRLKDEQ